MSIQVGKSQNYKKEYQMVEQKIFDERKKHCYDEEYHIVGQKEFDATKWGTRHNQCIILFFTLTIEYCMRSCLGVALVAMTQNDRGNLINADDIANNSSLGDEFENNGILRSLLLAPPYPKFQWTKQVQATVMSSFFWGYLVLQIPAGQLAYRFGARYLLFGSLVINSLTFLMLPVASYYGGWKLAVICRMIQGLSQSCIYPSFHTLLGKWAPLEERGRMSALIYRGQPFGIGLGLPLSGFIASSSIGWPGIFWVYGILSGITAAVVWLYLADSPADHKRISIAERRYIEDDLRQKDDNMKHLQVPWKSILTNRGMIAIIAAHIGAAWTHLIMYSEVPPYMDQVMGVNIEANGLLTALPYVVMFFTNFFFSWLTDMLIVKKYLTVTQTRKLANTLGCLPAAIGFVSLAYVPKNIYVIESILITMGGFKTSDNLGYFINHIDISPNFSGIMIGISNFSANCIASFAPIVAGLIVTDVTDEYLWSKVFFIAGGVLFFTNLVYVILGTGERADWNDPKHYQRVAFNENILIGANTDSVKNINEDMNKIK